MKSSTELRTAFLDYFIRQGHKALPSGPLVPPNDPTLLFTNAGMVQFKDVFLGREPAPYPRVVTSQCCVRAGGKHNDLENVGYTARHHTFFEMLGNFSFGDYFKREAIRYAWEFLTGTLKIPAGRLWVTVYTDDDEAADIWLKEMKVDPGRFSRCGDEDNFWAMGDTGPCGPCSEIFYDHGEGIPGGPPGSKDADGDRYVEIWNLVFTQYDRTADGVLHPIPHPSVDTGMGLERLAAVMQGVHSNYDIDLFKHLITAVRKLAGRDADKNSMQVIADHIRSCAFLIAEGVTPSNEGRGYVLRRIIRRALRHGHKLGLKGPFFYTLVPVLERDMGAAYPGLSKAGERVMRTIKDEEERFDETLDQGMKHLEQALSRLVGKEIPGRDVFVLYDTYGFPVDLTADFARERGLTIDHAGFEREMQTQRERARAASQFSMAGTETAIPADLLVPLAPGFQFTGHDTLNDKAVIRALFAGGKQVHTLAAGATGVVVLDRTPFYAESGGQVGDVGRLRAADAVFEVADTRKQSGVHLHLGQLKLGRLKVGDPVEAQVDAQHRQPTRLNHSATHLLHAALRQVLGKHVTQKGSLVAPDRLRFDFSHSEPVSAEQCREIERLVNAEIRANREVRTRVMPIQKAMESGAMALFGEKYDDDVRVLNMGEFSVELCGGTHVARTGDIGLFKIIAEGGVAAGVRRIEALTGEAALSWVTETEARLKAVADQLKANRDTVTERVAQLLERSRQQDKDMQALKGKLASGTGTDLTTQAVAVGGARVLAARLDGADAAALRDAVDQLKNKLGSAAVVLAAVEEGRVRLIAGVTKDLTGKVPAGELVNQVAQQVGGKGGGRPDMAQAGGTDPSHLDAALESVVPWVKSRLGG
ncbi:MAG TPA: alanine--tRNA ligase [Gammaproteobacteria bacterium]|nr:alanine--tRNA ligase [Gammaproteobacteria bacterium]